MFIIILFIISSFTVVFYYYTIAHCACVLFAGIKAFFGNFNKRNTSFLCNYDHNNNKKQRSSNNKKQRSMVAFRATLLAKNLACIVNLLRQNLIIKKKIKLRQKKGFEQRSHSNKKL